MSNSLRSLAAPSSPNGETGKANNGANGANIQMIIYNDLDAAIEVLLENGWRVVYPGKLELETFVQEVTFHLREDKRSGGLVQAHACVDGIHRAWASHAKGLGYFVRPFLNAQEKDVERERELREKRKKAFSQEREDAGAILFWCFLVPGLVVLLICTVIQPESYLAAVLLSLGAVVLFSWVVFWTLGFVLVVFRAQFLAEAGALRGTHFVRCALGFAMAPALATICLIVMTVRHSIGGFAWVALIIWLLACCCSGLLSWFFKAYGQRLLANYRANEAEETIVFEGAVLPGRGKPCVCSWPGKYMSAWDVLVQNSRDGDISAAVVFLPEGSHLFGKHNQIPAQENLEGNCWCVPLYGEKKPWGCCWWTKWIENIEIAVQAGAELEVYFFEKRKGQGKVHSFHTAGTEHMRREKIYSKRKEFEDSQSFQAAVAAGLQNLSREKGSDSSSQYSREWHRLFLAWLPEEDREFLEASEGLGNSQKAEVAWLEKKGYNYTEIEIDVAKWESRRKDVSPPGREPSTIGTIYDSAVMS